MSIALLHKKREDEEKREIFDEAMLKLQNM